MTDVAMYINTKILMGWTILALRIITILLNTAMIVFEIITTYKKLKNPSKENDIKEQP